MGVTTYGTDSRCGGHPLLLRIYVGAGVERGAQRRTPEYGTSVARSAERGVAERSTTASDVRTVRRTGYGIRHTTYGIRHTTYGIRHTTYDGV